MIKFNKEYSPLTQLLINELRLAGYVVGVPVDSNLSGDLETAEAGDMDISNNLVDGLIFLSGNIDTAFRQITDYSNRYKFTSADLPYPLEEAIHMLKDSSPEYVARLIGKSFPVYVLSGDKSILIITSMGNYYKGLPGLVTMATNILTTIVSGIGYATEAVIAKRLATCRSCPFILTPSNRCVACGCHLDIKAPLAAAKCPKGKWND